MNERDVQISLEATIRSSIIVAAPNYTPRGWWECDLWAVTRHGYAVEYEIKLSPADFRADRKKSDRTWMGWDKPPLVRSKHNYILTDENAPSRFFYVFPETMRDLESELPTWAGLMIYHGPRHICHVVKDAPKLHSRKCGRREIRLAMKRMWFRYWDSLRTIERMQRDYRHLQQQTSGGTAA